MLTKKFLLIVGLSNEFCWNIDGKVRRKTVWISKRAPIMPALCLILNSVYYANNYASIFNAALPLLLAIPCNYDSSLLGHISLQLGCLYMRFLRTSNMSRQNLHLSEHVRSYLNNVWLMDIISSLTALLGCLVNFPTQLSP